MSVAACFHSAVQGLLRTHGSTHLAARMAEEQPTRSSSLWSPHAIPRHTSRARCLSTCRLQNTASRSDSRFSWCFAKSVLHSAAPPCSAPQSNAYGSALRAHAAGTAAHRTGREWQKRAAWLQVYLDEDEPEERMEQRFKGMASEARVIYEVCRPRHATATSREARTI